MLSNTEKRKAKIILRALANQTRIPEAPEFGACLELTYELGREVSREIMRMVVDWPQYSGEINFPVPHPEHSPKVAYASYDNLWQDDAYGDARRDLCGWLADKLEEMVKENG